MKLLFIYLLLLLAPKTKSDFVKPSSKSKFFVVTKASKIKWQSGAPDGKGAAGIDYELEIKFTKDMEGYFKMMWIGDLYIDTKFRNPDKSLDYNHFKKGDIIKIYGTEMTRLPNNPYFLGQKNKTQPPFKYTGVAMLEYVINSKTYCYTIAAWNEEKTVNGI